MSTAPTPVLVMLGEHGPIAGRLIVDYDEIEEVEGPAGFIDARPGRKGEWRIEIAEVPRRFFRQVAAMTHHLGPPVEVRIWTSLDPEHYVGTAYVHGGDPPLSGGPWPFVVRQRGELNRARQ